MSGISSIGTYLSRSRTGDSAADAGHGRVGAHRFVVPDQDPLTMAVEAAHRCLEEVEPLTIGGLFFASVTALDHQGQAASAIATVCDLPRDIVATDFTGSPRAGVSALITAARMVEGGHRKILVIASDCRRPVASQVESAVEGAAVAIVVDARARLSRFIGATAVAEDLDFQSPQAPDPEDEVRDLGEVIERVINESGVGADELVALALGATGEDVGWRLAALVGLNSDRLFQGPVGPVSAAWGTPEALLGLAGALEKSSPGDRLVVAASGQGAEAVLFEAGDGAGPGACRRSEVVAQEGGASEDLDPGPTEGEPGESLRGAELERATRLYGMRCPNCSGVEFPRSGECLACGNRDGLEPAKLSKDGRIVAPGRVVGAVIVELTEGARIEVELTDRVSDDVPVGSAVRLGLRRARSGRSVRYVWKARPN